MQDYGCNLKPDTIEEPMIQSDATFGGTFAFAPHFTDAPAFRMHFVDEGPRDGEVVLCLHGEPTWG
jgi:haloalkane dehalogenase